MSGQPRTDLDLTKYWQGCDLFIFDENETLCIYVSKEVLKYSCPGLYKLLDGESRLRVDAAALRQWTFKDLLIFMNAVHDPYTRITSVRAAKRLCPIAYYYKAFAVLHKCDKVIACQKEFDFDSLIFAEEYSLKKAIAAAAKAVSEKSSVQQIEEQQDYHLLSEGTRTMLFKYRSNYLEMREEKRKSSEKVLRHVPGIKLHTIL